MNNACPTSDLVLDALNLDAPCPGEKKNKKNELGLFVSMLGFKWLLRALQGGKVARPSIRLSVGTNWTREDIWPFASGFIFVSSKVLEASICCLMRTKDGTSGCECVVGDMFAFLGAPTLSLDSVRFS
jgi:hypothetical protein